MDGAMTLLAAHAVTDALEAKLQATFPGAEVLIHQDPAGIAENRPHFA
jgi:ferrous-iron efflux pump FieF